MRTCESCGRENPDERDFCECGEYLRWDPTDVVRAVTPDQVAPVQPAAPPPPPAAAPRSPSAPPTGRRQARPRPEPGGAEEYQTAHVAAVRAPAPTPPPEPVAEPEPEPEPEAPPPPPPAAVAASARPEPAAPAPPPPPREEEPAKPPEKPLASISLRHPDEEPEKSERLAVGVEAGGRARILALVRNQSGVVDNLELAVRGMPDTWWSVHPGTVYLVPFGRSGSYEQEVEVHLHPPRAAEAEARVWELELVASSRAHAREAAAEPFLLSVQPFEQYTTKVAPQRASGRRRARFTISLENQANAPLRTAFTATEPDGACRFDVDPPLSEVAPGETAKASLTVRPPRQLWLGRPVERRLEVQTHTGETADAVGAPPAAAPDGAGPALPPGVQAPKVGDAHLDVGPQGVQLRGPNVQGPQVPRLDRQISLDPRKLKLPTGPQAPKVTGPLLPTQAVFRQLPWLPWWLAVIVPLLLVAAFLVWTLLPRTTTVPEVTGAASAFEAEERLRAADLRLAAQVREREEPDAAPGTVLEQTPAAGEGVDQDSEVAILVAVGDGQVEVPNVTGRTGAEAEELLREAGLTMGKSSPTPLTPESEIASQLPAAEETVKEGAPVDVFLAERREGGGGGGGGGGGDEPKAGAEPKDGEDPPPGGGGGPVVVPAVDGAALDAYAQEVSGEGLVPAPTRVFDAAKPGTLVGTDPEAGTEVEGGSRVRLLVSAGFPRLAFDDGENVLVVNGATGRGRTAVAESDGIEKDPSFAPDGRRVAFVLDGRVAVARVGSEDEPQVLTEEGTEYRDVSWAPDEDSDVLAMARIDGDDRDLCVGRIVEGTLSPTCKEDDDHATGHPRWSPDGRTLLVRANRGEEFGIVRYRSRRAFSPRAADWRGGRFATPLEPGRGVLEAAISPDGERLAAIANLDTRVPRLYVTEARDLRLRDADPVPNVRACKLAWRADSRELVIVDLGAGCTDGTGQLSRLDVGDPTRAVPLGAAGDNPSFQPRKLPG